MAGPDPTSSALFGPLFATYEMRAVFSDRAAPGRMLVVDAALATAEATAGVIPRGAAAPIAAACNPARFEVEEIAKAGPAGGNIAIPLVKALTTDAWVDRSISRQNEFNAEFMDLISRYAWGEIWTRPGLDDRTRRFIVIATTIALGRWEEYRLHVRAAIIQGGVTKSDLKEVIMQQAIYAGVPAANAAFHMADEVFAEIEKGS